MSGKTAPPGFTVVTEGTASVLSREKAEVFYNPAQVANRDLSIAMIRWYIKKREEEERLGTGPKIQRKKGDKRKDKGGEGEKEKEGDATERTDGGAGPSTAAPAAEKKGITVLEAMAASGLRSIRYANEIEGISRIDCNDLDATAVENIKRNVAFNGGKAEKLVHPIQGDCRMTMYQRPLTYDVVDLDPYGSPSQMLDAAVQSAADGGLLCVTATDMAVLCGNNGEVCFTKYGSYPLHKAYCHEQALRILLASIESHAARYKRYIVPVLSLSIDFYVRVFVRIYTSAQESKKSASKLAYVYQSQGCDSFYLSRVGQIIQRERSTKFLAGYAPPVPQQCPETGARFTMGGPIWAEPLHDFTALEELKALLKADKAAFPSFTKIYGLVATASEELPDAPLYFDLPSVCGLLRCTAPKGELVKSALINAGFRISDTHASPTAIKTDAPWSVVWDVFRCWVKEHPVKMHPVDSHPGRILAKEPQVVANWARAAGAVSEAKRTGVTRFWENPAFWGPKSAVGTATNKGGGPVLKKRKGGEGEAQGQAGEGEAQDAKKGKTEGESEAQAAAGEGEQR